MALRSFRQRADGLPETGRRPRPKRPRGPASGTPAVAIWCCMFKSLPSSCGHGGNRHLSVPTSTCRHRACWKPVLVNSSISFSAALLLRSTAGSWRRSVNTSAATASPRTSEVFSRACSARCVWRPSSSSDQSSSYTAVSHSSVPTSLDATFSMACCFSRELVIRP